MDATHKGGYPVIRSMHSGSLDVLSGKHCVRMIMHSMQNSSSLIDCKIGLRLCKLVRHKCLYLSLYLEAVVL